MLDEAQSADGAVDHGPGHVSPPCWWRGWWWGRGWWVAGGGHEGVPEVHEGVGAPRPPAVAVSDDRRRVVTEAGDRVADADVGRQEHVGVAEAPSRRNRRSRGRCRAARRARRGRRYGRAAVECHVARGQRRGKSGQRPAPGARHRENPNIRQRLSLRGVDPHDGLDIDEGCPVRSQADGRRRDQADCLCANICGSHCRWRVAWKAQTAVGDCVDAVLRRPSFPTEAAG